MPEGRIVAGDERDRVPDLSFVVAAHDVEPYIGRCLESILSQAGDVEVVVVDDASSDATPAIIDDVCSQDPRVRVVTTAAPLGPGGARNRGLDEASGRYVWFVDADDELLDTAVEAVRTRLGNDPDIVVVDFVRRYPNGRVAISSSHESLHRAPKGAFTLDAWLELVTVLHVPWNKVLRRDFLDEHQLRFGSAAVYEDVAFTYAALRAARAIEVVPDACYSYRTARPGALTRTTGEKHLVWADAWDATLAAATDDDVAVRDALFQRMCWHGWSVFGIENGWRVPWRLRRRFFHAFSAVHRERKRPDGPHDRILDLGWWPAGELRVAISAAAWVTARVRARLLRTS